MKDFNQRSNIAINGRSGANIKSQGNKATSLNKTPQKMANMKAIVHYMNEIEGVNNSFH